jgi:hypothetical protein
MPSEAAGPTAHLLEIPPFEYFSGASSFVKAKEYTQPAGMSAVRGSCMLGALLSSSKSEGLYPNVSAWDGKHPLNFFPDVIFSPKRFQ